MPRLPLACCFVLALAAPLSAADAPKLYRGPVQPHWIGQTSRFWYQNDLPGGGSEFVLVDATRGARGPAFDHARAAQALAGAQKDKEGTPVKFSAITDLTFSDRKNEVTLRTRDASWTLNLDTYLATAAEPSAREANRRGPPGRATNTNDDAPERGARATSPDGKWEAFARDHNLWLRDIATKRELQLSRSGSAAETFHRDMSRARMVSMQYDRADAPTTDADVRWAPDSKHLVALQTHTVPERRVTLVESSPSDQLQPKVQSYPYLKPGDDLPVSRPRLFDVAAASEVPIDQSGLPNPWAIDQLRWAADSSRFTFQYNQRGHQVLQICAVDAATGALSVLIDERSNTFVHYSRTGRFTENLDATGEMVWPSERDGWLHLYLYDLRAGRLKNQITRGEWVVRGVEYLDRNARTLWFRAGGAGGLDDPYYEQLCRVSLDGSGFKLLTPEHGFHRVDWSPDHKFFVDTWSRVDAPPHSVLRRADDGAVICKLEDADASEILAARGRLPERFVAKGRDGTTDIYGIIMRPKNFDPAKKYPVLERIYAGPHGYFTPKTFGANDPLLERGFIVVQLDGMGTVGRSKKFHDVCWKNVADAGFPDRIAWLRAAAAKFPEFDLSRLGVFGTSAGGQSALGALLFHGDFYQAAASDCGCHDNRMDKVWWNEQWMGWPVGSHYAENSNVTNAHRLQGKLFLAVGELDKNVDPSSTFQVAAALARARKPFEYLVLPGAGHGVFRTPYGRQRMEDFFARTFLAPSS